MSEDGSRTVGGVVLASADNGYSPPENSLLRMVDGAAAVSRAVDTLVSAHVTDTAVVTGHDAAAVERHISHEAVSIHYDSDHANGRGTSLGYATTVAGNADWDAVVVLPGHMPYVAPSTVNRLVAAYRDGVGTSLAPQYRDQIGAPVLLGRAHFGDFDDVPSDADARSIARQHPDTVRLSTDDSGTVRTVDSVGPSTRKNA